MTPQQQARFDRLFERVLDELPEPYRSLLGEVSIVLMDRPDGPLLEALRADGTIADDEGGQDLCGLHTGVARTERSVEDESRLPDQIHLFREGIVGLAGGWEGLGESVREAERAIEEEIRITLLHEIGHHFGLDEGDLEDLGYA